MTSDAPAPARTFLLPTLKATRPAARLTLLALLVLGFVVTLVRDVPPDAVPADAPAEAFSSSRAMTHLRTIAARPHASGTAAHAEVRSYLVQQLKALGWETQVQEARVVSHANQVAATVRNVLARKPGTASTKAVMLAAHYDSKGPSPGAGDDGAGVAALLESARALNAGPPLRNDVIVAITDAEEFGLLGAQAFVDEHPWAESVGVVLNLEARGTRGPAWMFETSDGNGRLIDAYARAVPHPRTTSLAFEVYRLMPNNTDLTVFRNVGMAGMGFGFVDGAVDYHTPNDSLAHLDERSLQHHGSTTLALARDLGGLDLNAPDTDNHVYFDILGLVLIHYPFTQIGLWTALGAGLWLAALAVAAARGLVTLARLILAIVAHLLIVCVIAGTVYRTWAWISEAHPSYGSMTSGEPYNASFYFAAFAALALGLQTGMIALVGRWLGPFAIGIGGLFWWLILSVALSYYLPGASFLAVWILVFGTLGVLVAALRTRPDRDRLDMLSAWVLGLCAGPALYFGWGIARGAAIGLTVQWSAATIVPWALGLSALGLPFAALMSSRTLRIVLPISALLLALGFHLKAERSSGFNADHPRPNAVAYLWYPDQNRALLALPSGRSLDSWTHSLLRGGTNPVYDADFLRAEPLWTTLVPAPPAPSEPEWQGATLETLGDSTQSRARTVRIRIKPSPRAALFHVFVKATGSPISVTFPGNPPVDWSINGRGLVNGWSGTYIAPPPEGVEAEVHITAGIPLAIHVLERSFGLPDLPAAPWLKRPSDMMSAPINRYFLFSNGDTTLVRRDFALGTGPKS